MKLLQVVQGYSARILYQSKVPENGNGIFVVGCGKPFDDLLSCS